MKCKYTRKHKIDHTPNAIKKRLVEENSYSYLKDAVYGAIDGGVTTFAVVSSVAGAGLSAKIVLIMGVANLIADGFSMAVGNYMGTKSELERNEKLIEEEKEHIRLYPEGEKEEIRQIFIQKGFSGDSLETIVETITSDEDLWLETMLKDEHGLATNLPCPKKAGIVTFLSFLLVGLIPLCSFLLNLVPGIEIDNPFLVSVILTGVSFFIVGAMKSIFVIKSWIISGVELLVVGALASGFAYYAGMIVSNLLE